MYDDIIDYSIPLSCSFRKGCEMYGHNLGRFLMDRNFNGDFFTNHYGTILVGNLILSKGYIPLSIMNMNVILQIPGLLFPSNDLIIDTYIRYRGCTEFITYMDNRADLLKIFIEREL